MTDGDTPIERDYGVQVAHALHEIVRLTDVGARLAARGRAWYDADPDNVPGLASEGLIIKIGENVARVSATCRADHPEVPWRVIKDMRNRLTHYYEGTDYDVVWATVEEDLPEIRRMVAALLDG